MWFNRLWTSPYEILEASVSRFNSSTEQVICSKNSVKQTHLCWNIFGCQAYRLCLPPEVKNVNFEGYSQFITHISAFYVTHLSTYISLERLWNSLNNGINRLFKTILASADNIVNLDRKIFPKLSRGYLIARADSRKIFILGGKD